MQKNDSGKDRWDLLPWEEVREIVQVLTHGAQKYSPFGWREVPHGRERYFAALLRHLVAWWQGRDRDPESGLRHLAHAGCCLLFLMSLDRRDGRRHRSQGEDERRIGSRHLGDPED